MTIRRLISFALLFGFCSSGCAQEASDSRSLVGFYVSHDDMDSYLGLRNDGKALVVTKRSDGSWHLAMTSNWSVTRDTICQRNIAWTSTGLEFFKDADFCTKLRIDGSDFYTQHYKGDEWIRWERTDHDIFKELEGTPLKFPPGASP